VTRTTTLARPATLTAAVAGTALLAARPALVRGTAAPTVVLVVLFAGILVVGIATATTAATAPRAWAAPLALGVGVFAVGRVLGGGHGPAVLTTHLVVLNTFAAVAEEAFFRRLWYSLLLPAGPLWAVVGSAAMFAVVHLATYGPAVLPLDLAAGLVLGWQRWATGDWTVPAVTHVVANILVVL
jgi:hypothetical protein